MNAYADLYPKFIALHRATNARVKALIGLPTMSRTTLKLRAIKVRPQRVPLYKKGRVVLIGDRKYIDSPSGLRRVEPKAKKVRR